MPLALLLRPVGLSAQLPDAVRWSVPSDPPAGAPVVVGSVLMLPLTDRIAAHRLSDGEPIWTVDLAAQRPLAADADRAYVVSDEAIHALNGATGGLAWRLAAGGPVTAPPLAHGGWVVAAAAGDLLAIRASDGGLVWRKPIGPVEFRPALDGDLLVVSVMDGRVAALDLQTGDLRWELDLGSAPTEPLVIGNRVYVGTEGKTFVTLRADSGRLESRWSVGALIRGRAAVDERHIYFAAMDNLLWAIDRGDGAIEWRKGLPYRPGAGPVVLGSAVVVPASETSLPVFNARTGAAASQIAFPERPTLPVFGEGPDGTRLVVGVTGGLENKWTLTMMTPSPMPTLALEPLTTLPGEVVLGGPGV